MADSAQHARPTLRDVEEIVAFWIDACARLGAATTTIGGELTLEIDDTTTTRWTVDLRQPMGVWHRGAARTPDATTLRGSRAVFSQLMDDPANADYARLEIEGDRKRVLGIARCWQHQGTPLTLRTPPRVPA